MPTISDGALGAAAVAATVVVAAPVETPAVAAAVTAPVDGVLAPNAGVVVVAAAAVDAAVVLQTGSRTWPMN